MRVVLMREPKKHDTHEGEKTMSNNCMAQDWANRFQVLVDNFLDDSYDPPRQEDLDALLAHLGTLPDSKVFEHLRVGVFQDGSIVVIHVGDAGGIDSEIEGWYLDQSQVPPKYAMAVAIANETEEQANE